ncbi:MAG TPA: 23S rRNA (uracil(1939)-C(5))-methyltransferase RlmD [Polyangia bacterium]|jgi:23S rRNA (uracil1939-C5)-methyltransferase|nr:23S rRNA (uracil(1939)-C(5))-methyltransferase RlmD [Polyangia bacterium]
MSDTSRSSGVKPGERVTVTCVDLDDEGAGISAAPADGPRVHVAGALPGERVSAVIEHVSSHAPEAWARLTAIETRSPARRHALCRAFGSCGGCILGHFDHAAQLGWKRERVARALANIDVEVGPCVGKPFHFYRNRSKLVPARIDGRVVLGAYAPRTHVVVDTAGCSIATPPLDDTATALAALLDQAGVVPYDERTLAGDLRHVVLRANADGRVLATWVAPWPLANGPELARAFRVVRPEVVGVVEHINRGRGNAIFAPDTSDDRILDGEPTIEDFVEVRGERVRVRLSGGAFFQANHGIAGEAYAAIVNALSPRPGERVVDAYCGVGAIGIALARAGASEIIGIEVHAGAVADATASAALNRVTGVRFVAGDVAREIAAIDRAGLRADLVVLNPPRKGCAPEVLAAVVRLAPRAIAYLSCDPDTLGRDLAWLASHGYRATSVTPYDMLPYTPHVEALAIVYPAISTGS